MIVLKPDSLSTCFLLLSVGMCGAVGCGESYPSTYPVTGQVVFEDNSTLKYGGRVIFMSTNVSPKVRANGSFGPDGKFELTTFNEGDGAVAGIYQVAVIPLLPDDSDDSFVSNKDFAKAMQPIDDRYQNPISSGIAFEVSAESSPHDFRVEVTPPQRRRR